LPEIRDSETYLEDTLRNVARSSEWDTALVSKQELSQILWAGYGYSYYKDSSPRGELEGDVHRTVPSAHAYYPMILYIIDSSGIYEYEPNGHTLIQYTDSDSRATLASATGNPWAAFAPSIIVIAWDENIIMNTDFAYVEAGLITQNIFLESVAWGLNVDWGMAANAETVRNTLNQDTNIYPAIILTIGH
jgi:hypothetical protein